MPAPEPVASLPMYDHPALRAETDRLWGAIAAGLQARGIAAPAALDRREDYETPWLAPGLVLSQTCGFPFATMLRGRVRLVATPCYDLPGCEGPAYRSALVVRADDPAESLADCAGRVPAVNALHSQSGHNTLRAAVAELAEPGRPFLAPGVPTGSHRASVVAVAEGRADLAAIDCVSFALLVRHEPELAGRVRVLGWTPAAPGLPLITALGTGDAALAAIREVLAEVAADAGLAAARAALGLTGYAVLPEDAYDAVLAMRARADAAGQPPLLAA